MLNEAGAVKSDAIAFLLGKSRDLAHFAFLLGWAIRKVQPEFNVSKFVDDCGFGL